MKNGPLSEIQIAYVFICFNASTSGVYKKILDQARQWNSYGRSVRLVIATDESSIPLWKRIDPDAVIFIDKGILIRLINRLFLVSAALRLNPKVVYVRDSWLLRIPRSQKRIICEIQTDVKSEILARYPISAKGFDVLRKKQLRNVTDFIFVSSEIQNLNMKLIRERNSAVISNGIDLKRFEVPKVRSKTNRLIFIGHPEQAWQGVDQVVELAQTMEDFRFDIVGERLTASAPPNVFFHGPLTEVEYLPLVRESVAGLGTLAVNRKSLTQGSSLKVREYLAMGLPVILRYRDSDLAGSPFILELPLDDRPISEFESQIRRFIDTWSEKSINFDDLKVISSEAKEFQRLGFLGLPPLF